jgi:hypothetical protein
MAVRPTLAVNGETMKTRTILPALLLLALLALPARVFAGDSHNPPLDDCNPEVAVCTNGTSAPTDPDGGDSHNPPISLDDLTPTIIVVLSLLS